jgi:hypothetical protein
VNNDFNFNNWVIKKHLYPETHRSDFATCFYPQMALVNNNKLYDNENNEMPFNFFRNTAYHFDATKFGLFLKDKYCLPRGVNHIVEDIKTVEIDDEGIQSLNNNYKADLYFDCTGFKSLLLEKSLQEEFESYSDMLPNNSAWATRIPYNNKEEDINCYTNCTAIENGWVWQIPLWSRWGTGYVYSDLNGNCSYDTTDLHTINIPVKLFDNQNNLLATSYLVNGSYGFTSLQPDSFQVKIDDNLFPIDIVCGQANTQNVTLDSTNQTIININFPVDCDSAYDLNLQSLNTSGFVFPGLTHIMNTSIVNNAVWYNLNCGFHICRVKNSFKWNLSTTMFDSLFVTI